MKNLIRNTVLLTALLFNAVLVFAQTSWKGTTSTDWRTASNWTAGVPTASTDVMIGDASFTGSYQPTVYSSATCKSLTIGGAKASTLTVSKTISVAGNVTITSNGSIVQNKTSLSLKGNWNNAGSYTASSNGSSVIFNGTVQTLGGTSATTFRKLTINAGSTLTLGANITISGSGSSLTVNGTINPGESPTYLVTSSNLNLGPSATLKVNAATFAGNYTISGSVTLQAGSTVDYSATAVNQTISNTYTYATLKISGSGTKTLAGNLPALNSTSSSQGNISVTSGILNLSTYTANRGTTVAGGTFSVSNGATVKISGSNGFPANYAANNLSLTSTIEYNGGGQTVAAQTYGNLTLTGTTGAVTKTLPGTAFTIAGDLTMTVGGATSVAATAASNIIISGNTNLGANTTFNAGSYSHTITGNWTNNGTFNGNTSTLSLNGSGSALNGTGAFNFNNVTITASNNTANADLLISGNLATTGSGSITVTTGKTLTMSGTSKTISGSGIVTDNFSVTGSVTTATSFTVTGNTVVSGSFAASAGTVSMTGSGKTISGSGSMSWYGLTASGSISTTSDISIEGSLNVSGSYTAASPSTTTFTGTSSLNGTANLHHVTINGVSLQLATNAVLGIAGTFTITAGTLNVSSTIPNTVLYNGTASQSVLNTTYHHLSFANGGTKTAAGAITVNGDLTISTGSNFTAGNFTHAVLGNWVSTGSFTAGTGTISFTGNADASITGATTFNTITINKTAASNQLALQNDVNTAVINMTSGTLQTNTSTLTITNNRTGNGIILGTIKRQHVFSTGVNYAFESPNNTITFSAVSGISSVTVKVTKGAVADFPFGAAINKYYEISVPAGAYTATLRLHYEEADLNGSSEADLQLWRYNGSAWINRSKTSNDATANYVELGGLTDLTNRWTLSDNANVVRWTGANSSDWSDAGNWATVQGTPSLPPAAIDIVQIGSTAFTNAPVINGNATAKSIVLGSSQSVALNIQTGGSLTVQGNISGNWSANATHTITNAGTLTINGNLILSDGTTGHAIDYTSDAGTNTVSGSITQSGNAAVSLNTNSVLYVGDDYNYTNGTFAGGSSTVYYNGSDIQTIAPVAYYKLEVNKPAGIAQIAGATTVGNALTITNGRLDIVANTTITGAVNIASGAMLTAGSNTINVGGNWSNYGTFIPGTGTVSFNGTGAQSIDATTFNHFIINKSAGITTLSGNLSVNGDCSINNGVLNLSVYTANRTSNGGSFTMGNATSLLAGGASNFPAGFASYNLDANSTVQYNGAASQDIAPITYGHILFSNGGGNTKNLTGATTINGNFTINSGASVAAGPYTINLYGNWVNNGGFDAGTGAVLLSGTSKTLTGNTTFYRVAVYGTYNALGSDYTFVNFFRVLSGGAYDGGTGVATIQGDMTNSGSLTSYGTTTFTGTQLQTIRLLNAITSNSGGIINFNGNVSPVLNSTTSPIYATLNINNTAGINPSVNWTVMVAFKVSNGAVFNGGAYTHNFYGSFTNNGTVTSSGVLNIAPVSAQTVQLAGTSFASTGQVIFGGAGAVSVTGTPTTLTDVTISNTSGVTPATGWTIGRNFSIGSNGIFNAGANTYSIGGDVESNGTLNGGSSTFNLIAAGGQVSGSPATSFNHLIITGSTITANADFNIAGNVTTNGTLDASLAEVHFTGADNATINGSTTALAQFSVEKNANASVALARNLTDVALLTINSGQFDEGSYTITQDAAGGTLNIGDNGTLKIGSTNTLPVFGEYALDTLSTVEYNGTTQTISNTVAYGNLSLSSSGTKTAAGNLYMLNNFSLSNAGFAAGNYTHSIEGNWTMTSGVYTNTGNTIVFNGTGNQLISSTGAFNNLTVNKTNGLVSLDNAAIVNGTLSLTAGKLSLTSYNLTMGAAATITNAGTNNYIIAEGTGVLTQPLSAGTSKTFPVGRTVAYLPATLTLTAGSTADNYSVRVLNAPYTGGLSGSMVTSGAVNTSWVISEAVNGGTNATVQLQWPLALEQAGFIRSAARLAQYNSGWDYGTVDLAASGSNPYTLSRNNFTSLGVFAVSSFGVLPVSWLNITGVNEGAKNHIYWSTASEKNNGYFIIEASKDGMTYTSVGRVNGTGNTNTIHNYDYVDAISQPVTYYRIKQIDHDGSFSYSKVIVVRSQSSGEMIFRGNFSGDQLAVSIYALSAGTGSLELFDAVGKKLYSKSLTVEQGMNRPVLTVPHVAAGVYYLKLQLKEDAIKTITLIK